jgi:hypothetical protein
MFGTIRHGWITFSTPNSSIQSSLEIDIFGAFLLTEIRGKANLYMVSDPYEPGHFS